MWESLARVVGDNPVFTLVITIFGTTTIWLYKEFKEMIDSNLKFKITALNEKIKMYSQLQTYILAAVHQIEGEQFRIKLIELLGEYSAVMSEDSRRIALDYIKVGDSSYLSILSVLISAELTKLSKEKSKLLKNNDTDIDSYISKLYAPLKPILLIWLIIGYVLFSYSLIVAQHTWYEKLNITILFITLFISACFVPFILIILFDNSVPLKGVYKWGLYFCIVAAPLAAFICIEISIMSVVIQVIAISLLVKYNRRKKSLIITLD